MRVSVIELYENRGQLPNFRLLTRRIVSPIVPDPLLTDNVYDDPAAGLYNLGKQTKSSNSASTQVFGYDGDGAAWYQGVLDASGWHSTYAPRVYGQILYKLYNPGALSIGTDANRWTYNGAGRLKSIPGVITSQTYEADGQTKKITYANGVSTEFAYDANRRWLVRILTKSPSGTPLINNLYGRDLPAHCVDQRADPSESWDYGYDTLSRLTFVNNGGDDALDKTFSYDIADNMLIRTRLGAYAYPSGTAPRPHAPVTVAGRGVQL